MIRLLIFSFAISSTFFILTNASEWTPDPDCPYPDGDTEEFYPYPGDCTKYFTCFDGVKNVEQCPAGLWWHPEIKTCDYPGSYCSNDGTTSSSSTSTTSKSTTTQITTTKSTSKTTTSEPTTNSPTTPGKPGPDPRCVNNDSTYWSHPAFCDRFIECYDGNSYEMMCPPNLYFSEAKRECVAADLSECCSQRKCT